MKTSLGWNVGACLQAMGCRPRIACTQAPTFRAISLALIFASSAFANVTLTETDALYTLDNGIITARVAKASGDLVSLRYKNLEMLATILTPDGQPDLDKDPPGFNPNGLNRGFTDHQYAFWSHDAMGPKDTALATARITIDPKSNGGARGEVSVKGISRGRKMGTGPGARADGQFAADVEIRYALGRGESGVYTYCVFEHPADYPTTSLGEARFCAKLNEFFDWMSIAPNRNKSYPKELREGDKYVYTVVQSENPAFGWSSTTQRVGFWLINPSMEYISGGPTKVEFLGHRDTNRIAAPCILNYWRSSHYGGAVVDVAEGEPWKKVVGPFLLYANSGADPQAMYADARERQKKEASAWPYAWVAGVDYPGPGQRIAVKGQLALQDRLWEGLYAPAEPRSLSGRGVKPLPQSSFRNLVVGLTAPAWDSPMPPGPTGMRRRVDWQTDAKHYQFWTRATDDGRFEIPKVRPGSYTLHAFADGVLGELVRTDITIKPGQPLDLGTLAWTPVRQGRPVFEIGLPNRNGSEFAGADRYYEPEASLDYAKRFPNDVNFVVGRSDFRRDWFFQHVPHNENPEAKAEPFFGVRGAGRATPFAIRFDLPAGSPPKGRATLRLAICGTGAREIEVAANEQPAGKVALGPGDGVITRHGIQGLWYERELAFDAALLRPGANELKLTIPAGPINNGVIYDYLRLELEETHQ